MKTLFLLPMILVPLVCKAEVEFSFKLSELSDELDRPWGIAALPDSRIVITERHGTIRIYDKGKLSPAISGLPSVYNAGQGGLLDVMPHPDFNNNRWLYFTYSAGSATRNRLVLARATLFGEQLSQVKLLFEARPDKKWAYHFAGRMTFLPDRTLMFGVGDGSAYMEEAQNLGTHLGSLVRLNDDGTVPADNPFVHQPGALPEIYSYGHRNPQGLFYDKKRNLLISSEHGPKGGDEINLIQAGVNYGWPAITYGVDYSGDIISELTHKEGMAQPLLHWTPSIAPSSIQVYYGNEFPGLNGHLLNTTLKYQALRLVLVSGMGKELRVVAQQTHLKDQSERIRDIEVDDTGRILLITDSGKLWRLSKN